VLEGSKQYSFILDMDGCIKKRSRMDKVSMFFIPFWMDDLIDSMSTTRNASMIPFRGVCGLVGGGGGGGIMW